MHYVSIKQRIRNHIDKLLHIDRHSEYGYMAKDAYLASDVIVFCKKNLYLYENTSIPEGGLILNPRSKLDIIVEEDVWLGINVTLLNGAHIGRGCIVGAGCVISGEWPPYMVIAGNPARIIKPVFPLDDIIRHEEKLYPPEARISIETLKKIFAENNIR